MAIGWGFIGAGNYPNSRVAPAAALAEDTSIIAAYSRDQQRADEFAKTHGALAAYTSVEELLADSRVDVAIVASRKPVFRTRWRSRFITILLGARISLPCGEMPPPVLGKAYAAK